MNLIRKLRGVFYGWWIVAASFILYTFVGGIGVYGFSAFFKYITQETGWGAAETSLAYSLRSVEGGVIQPVIGFIVDRFGPRKCILAGIVIIAVSLYYLGRVNTLVSFYVVTVILAVGTSAGLSVAQYASVANWFRRRRSLALGILSAGYGMSGIMTPILVFLIHTYGWRGSLTRLGFAVLALGVPLSFVVRHRPEPYGYLPDGDKSSKPPVDASPIKRQDSPNSGLTVRECLKTRTFWLLTSFNFFTSFAQSAIMVHEMPYLTSIGISENVAAYTMFGITASSLIGRVGFSCLGDTYDKKKLIIIAAAMESAGFFIFAYIRSAWMIVPFLLLYGPGFGAPIPLIPAIQADCFGTKAFGALRGIMAFGWTVPGIFAPYFAGLVYDARGSYTLSFTIFAILCACAIPVMMAVKMPPRAADSPVGKVSHS